METHPPFLNIYALDGNHDPIISIHDDTGNNPAIRLRGLCGGTNYSLELTLRAQDWIKTCPLNTHQYMLPFKEAHTPNIPHKKPIIVCCDDGFEREDSLFHYLKLKLNRYALSIQGVSVHAYGSHATPPIILWRYMHGDFFEAARQFYLQARKEQEAAQKQFIYLARRYCVTAKKPGYRAIKRKKQLHNP